MEEKVDGRKLLSEIYEKLEYWATQYSEGEKSNREKMENAGDFYDVYNEDGTFNLEATHEKMNQELGLVDLSKIKNTILKFEGYVKDVKEIIAGKLQEMMTTPEIQEKIVAEANARKIKYEDALPELQEKANVAYKPVDAIVKQQININKIKDYGKYIIKKEEYENIDEKVSLVEKKKMGQELLNMQKNLIANYKSFEISDFNKSVEDMKADLYDFKGKVAEAINKENGEPLKLTLIEDKEKVEKELSADTIDFVAKYREKYMKEYITESRKCTHVKNGLKAMNDVLEGKTFEDVMNKVMDNSQIGTTKTVANKEPFVYDVNLDELIEKETQSLESLYKAKEVELEDLKIVPGVTLSDFEKQELQKQIDELNEFKKNYSVVVSNSNIDSNNILAKNDQYKTVLGSLKAVQAKDAGKNINVKDFLNNGKEKSENKMIEILAKDKNGKFLNIVPFGEKNGKTLEERVNKKNNSLFKKIFSFGKNKKLLDSPMEKIKAVVNDYESYGFENKTDLMMTMKDTATQVIKENGNDEQEIATINLYGKIANTQRILDSVGIDMDQDINKVCADLENKMKENEVLLWNSKESRDEIQSNHNLANLSHEAIDNKLKEYNEIMNRVVTSPEIDEVEEAMNDLKAQIETKKEEIKAQYELDKQKAEKEYAETNKETVEYSEEELDSITDAYMSGKTLRSIAEGRMSKNVKDAISDEEER